MSDDIGGSSFSASAPWTAPAPAPAPATPASTGATVAAAGTEQATTTQPTVTPGQIPETPAAEHEAPAAESHDHDLASPLGQVQALIELDSTATAAGVSPSDSSALAYIVKRGLAGGVRTPEQNAAERDGVLDSLKAMHGEAKAGYVVQWANREYASLLKSRPGLAKLMDASGASNSVAVIRALASRGWQKHCDRVLGKK